MPDNKLFDVRYDDKGKCCMWQGSAIVKAFIFEDERMLRDDFIAIGLQLEGQAGAMVATLSGDEGKIHIVCPLLIEKGGIRTAIRVLDKIEEAVSDAKELLFGLEAEVDNVQSKPQ